MVLLSIGYNKNDKIIYDRLFELCKVFKDRRINIAIVENNLGEMHYIKCILKDTESDIKYFENNREIFYALVTDIIYDFISSEYEIDTLDKLLQENYNYISDEEKEEIKTRCISIITGTGIYTSYGYMYSINRRNSIVRKIKEYLEENTEMILEGFIRFRLKDINSELTDIIDRAIEDYVIEKEYREFIRLLKYFVDIQESKYEVVNVFIDTNGDYLIKDEMGMNIDKDFFDGFSIDALKDEVGKYDILLSALITTSPKKIIIHGVENTVHQDAIDTMKSIFLDNLIFCPGCSSCKDTDISFSFDNFGIISDTDISCNPKMWSESLHHISEVGLGKKE